MPDCILNDPLLEDKSVSGLWQKLIALHPSEMPRAFSRAVNRRKIKPSVYWRLVRGIWLQSWSITPNADVWRCIFERDYTLRRSFMSLQERAEFDSLPELLRVYRRCLESARKGFSWSLSKVVAETYPRKARNWSKSAQGKPILYLEGVVKKEEIVGYLQARGEKEVIAFPECVEILREVSVRRKGDEIDSYLRAIRNTQIPT